MKYTQFRWLLVVMSLALAGLIALQVYWLNGAARAEQKRYEERVLVAMKDAASKLEAGEAYTIIATAMLPQDSLLRNGPGMHVPHGGNIRIIRTMDHDTVLEDSIGSLPLPPEPPMPPQAPAFIVTDKDSMVIAQDSGDLVFYHRVERFKTAMKGAWKDYVGGSVQAGDRMNRQKIGEQLSRSLHEAGIADTFSYGIYDSPGRQIVFASAVSDKQSLLETVLRSPLFPGDLNPDGQELRVLMKTGQARFLYAIWPQLLIALLLTGTLIGVFWLTYREALRQKKISEIRSDFINNMTHEFKTPIATISLAADTVTNPAVIGDAEKVRHYADLIRRENRRMNDQVEKVLELALAERNELRMVREAVDLDEILLHAVESMNLQAHAKGSSIVLEENDPLPVFNGDPFHLERTFTNLLDNAIKYSPPGNVITVSTKRGQDQFSISFADQGIGISEEEQSRIFDRFYRVSTGNLHDVKGFGLGLSYVKTIVERHGGKISLQSKAGSGSIFTISFPL